MKNRVLLVSALAVALVACKKEEEGTTTTTKVTKCFLEEVAVVDSAGKFKDKEKFSYSTDNKLTKIEELKEDGSLQNSAEVTVGTDGVTKIVEKDNQGTATGEESTHTYDGGKLTKVVLKEMDNGTLKTVTYTFTYTGSDLTKFEHTGGEGPNLKDIVWSNGNIASATLFFTENGIVIEIPVKVNYDDKNNVKAHYPNEGDNAIEVLNKNNITTVIADGDLALMNVSKGDTLLHRTYTYSGDNVATMKDNKSVFNEEEETSTFTITCKEI